MGAIHPDMVWKVVHERAFYRRSGVRPFAGGLAKPEASA